MALNSNPVKTVKQMSSKTKNKRYTYKMCNPMEVIDSPDDGIIIRLRHFAGLIGENTKRLANRLDDRDLVRAMSDDRYSALYVKEQAMLRFVRDNVLIGMSGFSKWWDSKVRADILRDRPDNDPASTDKSFEHIVHEPTIKASVKWPAMVYQGMSYRL